jgi:hypothetical protein
MLSTLSQPRRSPCHPLVNAADKLPPHDDQAEAGALACVLCAEEKASRLLDQLTSADFFDLLHQTLLTALRQLQAQGKPLDSVALAVMLKGKALADAGGIEYLTALPDQTPSAANFPTYLEVIREQTVRRAAVWGATAIQQLAYDQSVPASVLAEAARRMGEAHFAKPNLADLGGRRFDGASEPPPLRAVYTLGGICICTPGNLTTITAAVKAGKSAALGAMAAAVMPHCDDADLLGFDSANKEGRALLQFDSEQSPNDFWNCINRSLKRAGLKEPPPWFYAYCLTGLGYERGWRAVMEVLSFAAEECRGVHSILLDGAADFIADVNDAAESNAFVASLQGLAIKHECSIINVIHFNPGSDKSRGHLGSQLERKAETNLALEKDSDGTTVIYSTKNRRAGIPKDKGPRFKFDAEASMHLTTESRQMAKDAAAREELMCVAREAFGDRPAMRYSELQVSVKKLLTVSDRTAERKVAQMKHLGVIKPSAAGLFTISMPAESK